MPLPRTRGRDLATVCLAVALFALFAGCASEGDPFSRDVRPVVNVGAVSPADGATNVSPETVITVTFPLDLDQRTVTVDNVHVLDFSQADQLPSLEKDKKPRALGAKVLFEPQTRTLTVVPDRPLAPNARYQVLLQDVKSTTNVFFNTVVTTFTTGAPARTAPFVIGIEPPTGAALVAPTSPITITFSEPMDQVSTLRALSVAPGIPGTSSFIPGVNRSQLVFTPGGTYPPGQVITVTVRPDALDTTGVPMDRSFTSFFTTEPRPRVLEQFTIPANGEVRVPVDTPITVVFSTEMDQTSVPLAFSLVSGSTLITGSQGTFTFTSEGSPPRTRAVFQPANPLPVTTSVQIRIDNLARNVRGLRLDPLFFSTFVTAP